MKLTKAHVQKTSARRILKNGLLTKLPAWQVKTNRVNQLSLLALTNAGKEDIENAQAIITD